MKLFNVFVLLSFLLISTLLPINAFATTKEMYYQVSGTLKNAPGIYKAVPNGKSSVVLKEKVYTRVETKKPPMKLLDVNQYFVNGKTTDIKSYDDIYYNNVDPILDVQVVRKDIYFTKVLFETNYFDGYWSSDGPSILEIYKRSNSGKISKVVTDKVSSNAEDPFVILGNSMYYAKVINKATGNFTIIKSSLNGITKQIIQKGVDDFWIHKKFIYFVRNDKLYHVDLNGKSVKALNVKEKLYPFTTFSGPNYLVSNNSLTFTSFYGEAKSYFYDFSTSTTTKLPKTYRSYDVLDVDLQKKRIVTDLWDENLENRPIAVYDLKGKRIKTLKVLNEKKGQEFYSADAKTGRVLYIEYGQLKQIQF